MEFCRKLKPILKVLFLYIMIYAVTKLYEPGDENPISLENGSNAKKLLLPVSIEKVTIHLDLKGAPPKLDYLSRLLPILKEHGVDSLLMEYENMFPYENNLVNLSSPYKYSRQELRRFLTVAVLHGFEIFPLVQTIGHLEYALKLPEFKHLREKPDSLDSICPTKNESLMLIKDILTQIIEFHKKIAPLKHIHIGCDKAFQINSCSDCQRRKIASSILYMRHVETIVAIVKLLSPKTTILLWDDMFRQINPGLFYRLTSKILADVEPVVWNYTAKPKITYFDLVKYRSFKNIWIATAFKGAESSTALLPHMICRYLNHFNWMKLTSECRFGGQNEVYKFKGVVLIGWSRYKHTTSLCELLPPSVPSLILNVLLIKRVRLGVPLLDYHNNIMSKPYKFYDKYLKKDLKKLLKCENEISLQDFNIIMARCNYEGTSVYNLLKLYEPKIRGRWMDGGLYSITFQKEQVEQYLIEIDVFANRLTTYLDDFYENFVIKEYVNHTTFYQKEKIRLLLIDLDFRHYLRNSLSGTYKKVYTDEMFINNDTFQKTLVFPT